MLLDENTQEINYLENWPSHFYKVTSAEKRREILELATKEKVSDDMLEFRIELLNRRFLTHKKGDSIDNFMRAWMMIYSSHTAGVSFFTKKKLQKELTGHAVDLLLVDYGNASAEEKKCMESEWENFALTFLTGCTNSKAYCSTLFNFIPIADKNVAIKIASEMNIVAQKYPAQFGMEPLFQPFYEVLKKTYLTKIKNGEEYWNSVI